MAFKYLSTQERLRVLTAAAEESGMPLTPANRVALEEYVMSKLRNDPRELPVGALQRFISWVRELFLHYFGIGLLLKPLLIDFIVANIKM